MAEENKKIRKLTGAAMVVVTAVTVFMVKGFFDQANAAVQARVQQNTQLNYDMTTLSEGKISETGQVNGVPALTEADYAAAQAFVAKYAKEWNVQKYYNGQEWKIYELGKRMAIVAYNFLNDVEFTTGGYERFVGYDPVKRVTYIEETGEVIDTQLVGLTPKYEYVPEERHKIFYGEDIEYSTPAITISDQGVDMSEMGGPTFYLEGFRVEMIDGQEYLVNDYFDFAITYDGDYLEYCEPTISGKYQGYYAFI